MILDGTSFRLFGEARTGDVVEALVSTPGSLRPAFVDSGSGNHGLPVATRTALTARLASMAGITVTEEVSATA